MIICDTCNGTGRILRNANDGTTANPSKICWLCGGKGEVN